MTLEELKALKDAFYLPNWPFGSRAASEALGDALVDLAPELLALVEALNNCAYRNADGTAWEIESDIEDDLCKALDVFNAKLATL